MTRVARAWQNFLERLVREEINIHSLLLASKEEVLFTHKVEELKEDHLHRQFSITKTFTALAILFLEEEEKVFRSDRLLAHYPEFAENADSYLETLTIEDLLTMQSPYEKTTYKHNLEEPWVDSFFFSKGTHPSATSFSYDTSASHVLAHLVWKKTGKNILDYLREKALDDLGFSKEAYVLEDPQGHALGGSGLMCSIEDLYRFANILWQEGEVGGKRYLLKELCHTMLVAKVDTQFHADTRDGSFGYGYQLWRHSLGWSLNGMGGQYVIAVDDFDYLLITNADTQKYDYQGQAIFTAYFEEFVFPLMARSEEEERIAEERNQNLQSLSWHLPKAKTTYLLSEEETFAAKTYHCADTEDASWNCQLAFDAKEKAFHLESENFLGLGALSLQLHLDENKEIQLASTGHRAFASVGLIGKGRFYLLLQVIDEELGFIEIELAVKEDALQIRVKKKIERGYALENGFYQGKALV